MRSIAWAMLGAILALSIGAGQLHAATQAPKKPAATPDPRKTIGLISELGDTLSIQQIGIMVFGNEKTSVPIGNWGIDALVYAKASSIVKAHFNVIFLNLSKEGHSALAAAPGSLFGDRAGYICNVLRKETQGRSFSYYLRVTPREAFWQYESDGRRARCLAPSTPHLTSPHDGDFWPRSLDVGQPAVSLLLVALAAPTSAHQAAPQ